MKIKFLKKGIRIDGEYFPVFYSTGELKSYPKGTITVYVRAYKSLPDLSSVGLKAENNSDVMTDYFEKDKIRVTPDNPWHEEICKVNQACRLAKNALYAPTPEQIEASLKASADKLMEGLKEI